MSLLLALLAAPTVVVMTVWVSVSAVRLLRPSEEAHRTLDPVLVQLARIPARPAVPAGVSDTPTWFPGRDTWREFHHAHYDYAPGRSEGLPEAWWENVLLRQN